MTLQSLLESGTRPVITAELPSVDGQGLDKVHRLLESIAPYVDAINATDNPAAHAHASNVSIAIAMQQAGVEPIMQVVCRDKNRIAIQADIVGASMFGVRNICALTGDDVTAGDEPEARRVFDLDGPQVDQRRHRSGPGPLCVRSQDRTGTRPLRRCRRESFCAADSVPDRTSQDQERCRRSLPAAADRLPARASRSVCLPAASTTA